MKYCSLQTLTLELKTASVGLKVLEEAQQSIEILEPKVDLAIVDFVLVEPRQEQVG